MRAGWPYRIMEKCVMTRVLQLREWLAPGWLAGLLLVSCDAPRRITGYVEETEVGTVAVEFSAAPSLHAEDPLAIDSARVDRDRLHVFVTHAGGCAKHEYAAVAWSGWRGPRKSELSVFIAHNAHGDGCIAMLHRELRFDLQPVRRAFAREHGRNTGEIQLQLSSRADIARRQAEASYRF